MCLLTAVWLGLASGLIETGFQFGKMRFYDPTSLGLLQMNQHASWMITSANLLMFSLIGTILALIVLASPGAVTRRACYFVLTATACFSVLHVLEGLDTRAYLVLASGLGACLSRMIRSMEAGFRRLMRRTIWGMCVLFIGLCLARHWSTVVEERRVLASIPAAPAGTPNVLWVVIDTLRADRTSLHGHSRDTTPRLRKLAERGIVFEQARSPANWTLPSHVSMFTGHWPHELYNLPDKARGYPPRRLEDSRTTVAEYLRDRGFATAGFVANAYFCNTWFGLGQGFLRYEDSPVDLLTTLRSSGLGRRLASALGTADNERPDSHFCRRSASEINRQFLDWMDGSTTASRPFFAFLNYFDVHDPYLLEDDPDSHFGEAPDSEAEIRLLQSWYTHIRGKPTPDQIRFVRDCYDDCILDVDEKFGMLLDELDRRGKLVNTMVIVTSDHGELFGEHGVYMHGASLHTPASHVPLLIVPPGGRDAATPARVKMPVSLRNIPATIVDLAGGAPKVAPFPGRSLSRFWGPNGSRETDLVFIESGGKPDPTGVSKIPCSLVAGSMSYIRSGNGSEQMFDLGTDPDELTDLVNVPRYAEQLREFRRTLREIDDRQLAAPRGRIEESALGKDENHPRGSTAPRHPRTSNPPAYGHDG